MKGESTSGVRVALTGSMIEIKGSVNCEVKEMKVEVSGALSRSSTGSVTISSIELSGDSCMSEVNTPIIVESGGGVLKMGGVKCTSVKMGSSAMVSVSGLSSVTIVGSSAFKSVTHTGGRGGGVDVNGPSEGTFVMQNVEFEGCKCADVSTCGFENLPCMTTHMGYLQSGCDVKKILLIGTEMYANEAEQTNIEVSGSMTIEGKTTTVSKKVTVVDWVWIHC